MVVSRPKMDKERLVSLSFLFYFTTYKTKILRTLGKVGLMLSGETRILRKKITFQTKFWARGDAETYLHGTTLSDFTIVRS